MGSRDKSALLHWAGPPVVLPAADVAGPPAVLALPVAAALVPVAPPVPLLPAFVPVAAFAVFAVFAAGGLFELELQAHSDSVATSTEVPDRIFKFCMDKFGCAWCSKPAKLQKSNRHAEPYKG